MLKYFILFGIMFFYRNYWLFNYEIFFLNRLNKKTISTKLMVLK